MKLPKPESKESHIIINLLVSSSVYGLLVLKGSYILVLHTLMPNSLNKSSTESQ